MPIKSDNTKGNPYHDERNGEFTSKDGANSVSASTLFDTPDDFLKSFDVDNVDDFLNSLDSESAEEKNGQDIFTPLTMPTSIEDAEKQGNRILGSTNVVGYADDTDLQVANDYNQALQDVVRDFPKLFTNQQLFLYGTKSRLNITEDSWFEKARKDVTELTNSPVYQKRLKKLNISSDEFISRIVGSMTGYLRDHFITRLGTMGGLTRNVSLDKEKYGSDITGCNTIAFNRQLSTTDASGLRDSYRKNNIWNGWILPLGKKSYTYYIATHELGHHVYYRLAFLMNESEKNTLNKITGKDTFKLMETEQISRYARKSKLEQIAEAVSDVYCEKEYASKHNKKIYSILKKIYERVYG